MTGLRTVAVSGLGVVLCLTLMPSFAFAQSGIAGMAKDVTGAVLPGVTVEVSSPALIEGSRSVITDEKGLYRILDLRPGTYSVTFTLPGFNTFKRDAIELPANFTAPVNAEMSIGTIEQTVTVTGESPVVDVQNAVSQQVLPQPLLDAVPMGGRSIQSVGAILTGITQSLPDVGGAQGMQQTYMATHGADPRDNSIQVDGMSVNGIEGDGAIQQYFNQMMFSELSYQTGAISAETSGGGVRVNMIPKDGANTFKGDLFLSTTNHSFQAKALTPELVNRGLKAADAMDSMHDFNAALRTEEAFAVRNPKIYYTAQVKLTGTLSSRLLVEAGWSTNNETYTTQELEPSALATRNPIPRQDIILGTAWSAPIASYFLHVPIRRTWVTSMSYVTGAHAFKAGLQWGYGWNRSQKRFQQEGADPGFGIDLVQRYRNGAPDSVTVFNTPVHGQENLNADLGIYAQDSWTLSRLTITPGVRFEHFNTSIALETVG